MMPAGNGRVDADYEIHCRSGRGPLLECRMAPARRTAHWPTRGAPAQQPGPALPAAAARSAAASAAAMQGALHCFWRS